VSRSGQLPVEGFGGGARHSRFGNGETEKLGQESSVRKQSAHAGPTQGVPSLVVPLTLCEKTERQARLSSPLAMKWWCVPDDDI